MALLLRCADSTRGTTRSSCARLPNTIVRAVAYTIPPGSDRIPNAGIVPVFSSTDLIREDDPFLPSSNAEFADKILFVRQNDDRRRLTWTKLSPSLRLGLPKHRA